MAWGIEAFAYFDPFYWGAGGVIYGFIVWTIFAYLSARGSSEKPLEEAMQVVGYSFGLGLLMDFMMIPSMWVGIGMIVAYVYSTKYVLKWNWRKTIFVLTSVSINLTISALVSEPVKSIFLWGVIILVLLLMSQQRVRQKKIEAEIKPAK